MSKRKTLLIILITLVCCAVMTVVDGYIRPAYAVKSAIKIVVFGLLPALLCLRCRELQFLQLLRFQKQGFGIALALGVGVYAVIMAAYFIISRFFDFSGIVDSLSRNAGVTKDNFLFVSLYISFVNSLLEELFFRGFVFTNLKSGGNRPFAYGFSAIAFALYHTAMMAGWFSPVLFLLAMAGLAIGGMIFNYLNERTGTLYCSWLVHMAANFAINTVGFILMK